MNYFEVIQIAKENDWEFDRIANTSHRIWKKNGQKVIIPCHKSQEIKYHLCKKILKKIKSV